MFAILDGSIYSAVKAFWGLFERSRRKEATSNASEGQNVPGRTTWRLQLKKRGLE